MTDKLKEIRKNSQRTLVVTTYTTEQLFNEALYREEKNHKRWRFYIPMCDPVNFAVRKAPKIDPWLLGVLLGDGSLTKSPMTVTNTEKDIIDRLTKTVALYGCGVSADKDGKTYRITYNRRVGSPVVEAIKCYNLVCCAVGKFIPDDYKSGTIETRINILKGLLDTDGHTSATRKSLLEFDTISKQLAIDVQFIVQSLGGTATIYYIPNRGRTMADGSRIPSQDCYRVYVKSKVLLISSDKHLSRYKESNVPPHRSIQKIERIADQAGQCITVADEEQLYLCNDCIVTHNSEVLGVLPAVFPRARILMST